MVAAAVNVTGIDNAAVDALFNNAPAGELNKPVPASLISCQVPIVAAFDPFTSKAPPDCTWIILVAEPVHEPVT